MALELVTGHAGTPHVSAADVGAMLAGIVGQASYVLGQVPAVTMTDANTVSIGACEVLMQGRHVRLTGTNTLTVRSGTQGAMRSDLVCLRYEYDAETTVETVSLVVVEGTPGSVAEDPAVPNNASILDGAPTADVAVARVTLNGLAPTAEWLLPARGMGTPVLVYSSTPDEALVPTRPCFVYVTSTRALWYVG